MSKEYTAKEIERLKMRARLLDAFLRYGNRNMTKEQVREYNEILGTLRELRVKPWED